MYCPKCGTEQTTGGNFCSECGYKIIGEKEDIISAKNEENYKEINSQTIIDNKKDPEVKRKKRLLHLTIAIISIIFGVAAGIYTYTADRNGVSSKSANFSAKESIEDQLKSVVDLNIKAMQEEDLDKHLSTVVVPKEQISQVEETLKKLFKDYDLQYTLEDFKVLTTDTDDAQVQVVQTTKKLRGGDFRDNRITAIHHLKKTNGQWKIFKTDTKNIEYINEKASTQQETMKNGPLNQEQAVAVMKEIMPNGNFEYDHDETKDGSEYYVIRQAGKGSGTSPTVGWFYVNKKSGEAFKCNLANNTLTKVNAN